MRIIGVGHLLFAATLVGIGIWGLISGGFAAIWQPVPDGTPFREGLAYLCAVIALATGVGVCWKRTAAVAARLLLAYLLVWYALFQARVVVGAPLVVVSWENWAENVVIIAAAWALYAALADAWDRRLIGFASGDTGLRIARTIYGLAMTAFGAAHLAYLSYTASLVPAWLPAHVAWVYFTGVAYIAAGFAILVGVYARLAAALSVLQMGLFTFLVWAPVLAAGSRKPSDWSESVVSWTLTAAGWVIADSYRGRPWLARRKR